MSWNAQLAAAELRRPTSADDKYARGVLGMLTGSTEYPGAAVLGVEAAMRTGIGLVRYLGGAATEVLARRPEAVAARGAFDALVVGSGMPVVNPFDSVLDQAVAAGVPIILDAGALTPEVLQQTQPVHNRILTPHAGEAARLLNTSRSEVEADPISAAQDLSNSWAAVVVLKGATTHVSDGHQAIALGPQSPWLASAGTGDVLAGVIGALAASRPHADPVPIAATGVWLHAAAAERLRGPFPALDLAVAVSTVVAELLEQ